MSPDLNCTCSSGNPLLHTAVNKGHIAIVDLLIKNGASVNHSNTESGGVTALHIAVLNGKDVSVISCDQLLSMTF